MSSFTKREFRSAKLGALAFLVALTAAPLASAANNVGWVLVDQPDFTGGYTADAAHGFNSAHGSVKVGAIGQGQYQVAFDNLAVPSASGNILVSAYNSPNRCATSYPQFSGNTVVAGVTCYDQTGAQANTGFSLLYQTRSAPFGSASNGLAFLEQEGTTDLTAVNDSFNSTAGADTVAKSSKTGIGAGNYTVSLSGLTHAGGDVQVSSWVSAAQYGGTAQCKVQNWSASSSKGTAITVQCYRDDNGNPTFSAFNLAYAIGEPFGLVPGEATLGAWLWAQDLTSTTPYKPNPHFQYNGFKTGAMTAQKTSLGHYTVTIPGTLTYTNAVALVTAYGMGTDYCNVAGWTGGTINVVCYSQTQAFADSRFDLTFQTAR